MTITRILFGIAILAALVWGIDSTVANGTCCAGGSGSFAWNTTSVYSLPPCMAPGYGSMMNACCPTPAPTCCDHIWDGYCTERRCCDKLWWCRPTIGGRRHGIPCTTSPAQCSESESTPEPTSAITRIVSPNTNPKR